MRREDLTARVVKDMDPELFDFLTTYVDSFIKWDLLRFFHENPHTMDTSENIARYAGRTAEDVQTELQDLASQGLLIEMPVEDMRVYMLKADPAIRTRLQQFVEAAQDQEFRRKVIYHMVRH
ncbi:MAG: hypothetical protein JXR84_23985 [Anaerolineae bacterium]|nr:hypothetical protein [Anaerolineae bacterium]